jgi:hypothetical protein
MFIKRQPLYNADDGGNGGGAEPVSSNSEPTFTPSWGLPADGNQATGSNPLRQPPVATPPPVAEPTGQVIDFAGRKIEVSDPAMLAALKDVHKDYSALQGTYTQTSQRMKELEQANQTYLNLLQTIQPQPSAQPNAAQPPQSQPTPEDLEQMKADFMEKFYDNPLTTIEERVAQMVESLFQQKVQPVIEPITQERQWNEQMRELQGKYEDFQSMVGPMRELLNDMPHLADHGLEAIYQLAKRATPAPQPGPEQLMNDPQFVQQLMQNPEIQKQFLSQYLQEKQGTQQQAPTVMGSQPGGQMPSTPETRPQDIRTASQAFKRHLGIF